jgi:cytochrome b561
MKAGYSRVQILLHWAVAFLVPVQYVTGGSIERTHHAVHMGMPPEFRDVVEHHIHSYAGMVIGALMTARLCIRFMSVPVDKTNSKRYPEILADLLHSAFYAAIIGQATMGVIASYIWFGIAPYHALGSKVILGLLAVHLLAAAWHTFVWRDDTVDRMIIPR